MRKLALLAVALLAAATAACSTGKTTAAAPSPTAPRFDSPQAIVAALNDLGAPCVNFTPVIDVRYALARGFCVHNFNEIDLGVYADAADAQQQWQRMLGVQGGTGTVVMMVIGPNWTASGTDTAYLEEVASLLHAQLRHT